MIRKTKIQLVLSPRHKIYLDDILYRVHARARCIQTCLLRMKHVAVEVLHDNIYMPYFLETDLLDQPLFAELYDQLTGKIRSMHPSRPLRGPLSLPKAKLTEAKGRIAEVIRQLQEAKSLPVLPAAADLGLPADLDFAAFLMAVSTVLSWHEANVSTEKNYQQEREWLASNLPDEGMLRHAEDWMVRNKLYPTRRVVDKLDRFGWDIWLDWSWSELRAYNGDVRAWLPVLEWIVRRRKHREISRSCAAVSFINENNAVREVHFGSSYRKFSLGLDNGAFVFKVGGEEIRTKPSRYFKDLTLVPIKNGCGIAYRRGNCSPLPEDVYGEIKEVTLGRRNDRYYLGLPINIQTPEPDEMVRAAVEAYYKGEQPDVDFAVAGVDLGITRPACMTFVRPDGEQESIVIGRVRDADYDNDLTTAERRFRDAHAALSVIANDVKDLATFGAEWNEKVFAMGPIMAGIRSHVMGDLGKHDEHDRGRGVCKEQVHFILLFKKYISLMKRWCDFGRPTPERNERRTSCNTLYSRLAGMKRDFRKKIACEIVREARKRDVKVLVIEDLQYFKPDETQKAFLNELLMLWGKGQIAHWIKHFAEQYGIVVVAVNPRHTSQIDCATGQWGRRDIFDRGVLHAVRDGRHVKLPCDEVAAANVAYRFLTGNASQPFVWAKALKDGSGYAPAAGTDGGDSEKSKAKRDKQLAMYRRIFGMEHPKITNEGEVVAGSKKAQTASKVLMLYRHDGRWVTDTEHRRLLDELAATLEVATRRKDQPQVKLPLETLMAGLQQYLTTAKAKTEARRKARAMGTTVAV